MSTTPQIRDENLVHQSLSPPNRDCRIAPNHISAFDFFSLALSTHHELVQILQRHFSGLFSGCSLVGFSSLQSEILHKLPKLH